MDEQPQVDRHTALFYQSGCRYKLFDGCDRLLYGAVFGGCACFAYAWRSLWSITLALVIFFSARYLLRLLGKHEPLAVRIYIRSFLRDLAYVAAQSMYYAKRYRMHIPKGWSSNVR